MSIKYTPPHKKGIQYDKKKQAIVKIDTFIDEPVFTTEKDIMKKNSETFKTIVNVIEKQLDNKKVKALIDQINKKYMGLLGEKIYVKMKFPDNEQISLDKSLTEKQLIMLWHRCRIAFKSFVRDVMQYEKEDGTKMVRIGDSKLEAQSKIAKEELKSLNFLIDDMDGVYSEKIGDSFAKKDNKCKDYYKCSDIWCAKGHADKCYYDGKCTNKDCQFRHFEDKKIQVCWHWDKKGHCNQGDKCTFLHVNKEIINQKN